MPDQMHCKALGMLSKCEDIEPVAMQRVSLHYLTRITKITSSFMMKPSATLVCHVVWFPDHRK